MLPEKENNLVALIKDLDEITDEFFSYVKRPKCEDKVVVSETESKTINKIAVVMQGPLVAEDDFTYQTVRIYKKLYPGLQIIVSTWDTEDAELIMRLEAEENCTVVMQELPQYSGLLNGNYQIVSAMSGIRKAKELGKEFVLKTRSDFRFYKPGIFTYMVNLLKTFPVDEGVGYQKYRIINGNVLGGGMYRAWWLGDQYVFGYVDDMLNYWNYTLDKFDMKRDKVFSILKEKHASYKERIELKLAIEPAIVMDYIRRNEGLFPEISIKKYWEYVKKQFIMISGSELGFYWKKYERRFVESVSNGSYYSRDDEISLKTYDWNFVRWLNLYYGDMAYDEELEKHMNLLHH